MCDVRCRATSCLTILDFMDAPLRFDIYKAIANHVTGNKHVGKAALDAALATKGKDENFKFVVSKLQ